MCLGVPGEIREIEGNEAVVDFWGVERRVRLDIVGSAVDEGDYILNHVGYAIRKIPESEVEETMELFETMLDADPADMLTDDVMDELEANAGAPTPATSGGDEQDEEDLLDELGIDV
ncbi:HypC/HybG/HupF family hydrogenase formation chaperone [Natronomonas sp. LN261]|uniref:HypC/HybG/HupF family hydrogenase formation chaperone n=1 Tax=Natronomonas sp. LN261 TaxID=2750669 RepID=UPI0015EE633E|nr:HypC/HybG/HupF family hydrogenase formation chaperone [Natronomonas sp. LN261]